MADVSLVKCNSYEWADVTEAMEKLLKPIGGLDWVKNGMVIAIKVNLVSAMNPEKAATTHPAPVCALVDMLTARGAKVIVGDSPGGVYNKVYVNHIYRISEMSEVEKHGAELNQDFGQTVADNPEGKVLKSLTYTSWLDQADVIIDFCKLKSHGMMGLSGAVKNLFGVIPGTIKPEYHFQFPDYAAFADMLVDLNERFRPRLCIADAVIGMEGNGPTAGTPRFLGFLAASRSPYQLDAVCGELLGLQSKQVPTTAAAKARGLIQDCESISVFGDLDSFAVTDFQHVAVPRSMLFAGDGSSRTLRAFSRFSGKVLSSKPVVHKKECVGCGICAKTCPAKAIHILEGKADIDRNKCIRCFCCQEFCPRGAMKVKRSLAAVIAGKI